MPRISRAEVVAISGASLLLLIKALPSTGPLLEYRRHLLLTEPWRLLSGHVVHVNWTHVLINAAFWVLLAHLFAAELKARRQLLCLMLAAFFISASLAVLYPFIAWYRGFSGLLHALFLAGAIVMLAEAWRSFRASRGNATRRLVLAALFVVGGWIKVVLEQPAGAATPYAAWLGSAVVPQAHLLGALFGTGLGIVLARRRRS